VGPALDVLNARVASGVDAGRPALAAAPIDETLMPGSFATFGVAVGTAVIAMSMMVLLIACANLTNLLLARAASRAGELAIRRSLGASRLRVFRLLFVETAMVVLAGGLGGLLLAAWAVELLGQWTPTYEGVTVAPDLSLDGRVFLFTAAASAIAAFAIGTVPAWRGARTEAGSLLQSAGGQRWSGRRGRLSSILVAAQLAASVVLLTAAALFGRSALETLRHDVGFDLYGPALVRTNVELHGYDESQGRRYYERTLEAARDVPEIRHAALVDWPIFGPRNNPFRAVTEGTEPAGGRGVSGSFSRISPGFLATVDIPVLRGRGFTEADGPGSPNVVIINQRLASALWPSADPLGRRLRLRDDGPWLDVVGVAADTDVRMPRQRRPYAFVPFAQHYVPEMAVIAAGEPSASALVQPLAAAVRSVAPDVALVNATTLEASVNVLMLAERLGAIALLILGVLGAGIALIGIYGIVACLVGLRVKEIGIRMALGATRPQVVSLLVRQGARMLAAGLVPGLLLALAVAALVRSFLFRVPANDPAAYLIAPATLLLAGLLACYLPARRAARVDPNVALRDL
jgi:predicted permease